MRSISEMLLHILEILLLCCHATACFILLLQSVIQKIETQPTE